MLPSASKKPGKGYGFHTGGTNARTSIRVSKSEKWTKRVKNRCLGIIFSDDVCQWCAKRVCIFSWTKKRVAFWNEYVIRGHNFHIKDTRVKGWICMALHENDVT